MNTRGKRYHPVKPARSYKEQLARLTDIHGLTIEDEARARYILSTVNYYRLTTYGKHLRRADDPDLFLPGVSLETLYGLYRFDMNLRHLLLPVLEFFEVQLRAKIAYQLAITYGSLGYMDAENFRAEVLPNGASVHKSLIGKFKNEVKRQGALPFVRHGFTARTGGVSEGPLSSLNLSFRSCATTKSNTAANSRFGRPSNCSPSACSARCLTSCGRATSAPSAGNTTSRRRRFHD